MRLHWFWRVVVALGLVTSVPGALTAGLEPMTGPMPPTRMVLTQTDAFALLPPELVAAPVVTSLWFSPSGRYVMAARTRVKITAEMVREAEVEREPPVGEFSLVLWDSRERTAREVWKVPPAGAFVEQIEWLPRTDVALALVGESQGTEMRQALLRIFPPGGKAQVIPLIDPSNSATFELHASPTKPLAILHRRINASRTEVQPDGRRSEVEERRDTLTLIGSSGQPGHSLALPEDTRWALTMWVGLALMMYAFDNDGALPVGEKWRSQLELYVKDSKVLEPFIYTDLDGKLNDLKNPAEAELGYMLAPGGRVVVYADGHAALTKN